MKGGIAMSIDTRDIQLVAKLAIAYVSAHYDVTKMSAVDFAQHCDEAITEILQARGSK